MDKIKEIIEDIVWWIRETIIDICIHTTDKFTPIIKKNYSNTTKLLSKIRIIGNAIKKIEEATIKIIKVIKIWLEAIKPKITKKRVIATLQILLLSTISITTISIICSIKTAPKNRTEEIENLLRKYEKEPRVFCPSITNRKFWDNIKDKPVKKSPSNSTEGLGAALEGTYQECLYNTGEWIPIIEKNIIKTLDEPWRETKAFQHEFTDLYTTERAAELSFICNMLKDKLDPDVIKATKEKIFQKVFDPYIKDTHEYQKKRLNWGNSKCPWLETKNNWNSVCIANIIYSALAIIPDIKTRAKIIEVSEEPMKDYFETFTPDGYLPSGIRYWKYGFYHFAMLAERLILATNGKINLYDQYPVTKKAVIFPEKWKIKEEGKLGYYPLFTDNKNPTDKPTWIWEILKRRFNIPLPATEKIDIFKDAPSPTTIDLLLNPPKETKNKEPIAPTDPNTTYFESSGALISRDIRNDVYIATKGGNNNEEHNHNTAGGYTIFKGETTITGCLGAIQYTPATQGEFRYFYSANNSYGNPIPVIDNQLQNQSTKKSVKTLETSFTPIKDEITYELKNVYNVEGLKTLKRKITFQKGKNWVVTIKDSFEADHPINFSTPIITNLQTRTTGGKTSIVTPEGDSYVVLSKGSYPVKITQEVIPDTINTDLTKTRIKIELEEKKTKGEITYSIQKN